MVDDDGIKELLKKVAPMNGPGQLALAIGIDGDMVRVDFGRTVDFIRLRPDQADVLIEGLTYYRDQLRTRQ